MENLIQQLSEDINFTRLLQLVALDPTNGSCTGSGGGGGSGGGSGGGAGDCGSCQTN